MYFIHFIFNLNLSLNLQYFLMLPYKDIFILLKLIVKSIQLNFPLF